jgi:hypothetical protein
MLSSGCAFVRDDVIPDLRTEPWRTTRAGTKAVTLLTGVASDYEVDSTVTIANANFGEPSHLHGEMIGRYGFGLRGEYFVMDDWMLFLGGEQRIFEPDLGEELITFSESSQLEYFFGTRWFLPWRFLESQRLRAFLQAKVAYIPQVEFEMTTTLPFDPPLNDAVLVSPFKGGEYWSIGAGGGLAYQLDEAWMLSLGFFYEWPLTHSKGRAGSRLTQTTGNDFVDNIMNSLEYDIEIEPQGWIAFLNLSYAL